MKSRFKLWGIAIAVSLILLLLGQCGKKDTTPKEPIMVNSPQAMQSAFEKTLEDLKLHKKYEIKFANKEANFTVTTQKSDSNELIAYSPLIAVFNEDEEMYESYIEKEIFVPSDTEPKEYDFDFQKIMEDIIENPNSIYKVYYPDSSICNESVFYAFLLYTANDGCYPSEGANMEECKKVVDAFLQSKNSQPIGIETLYKIKGFSKNSIYFMPLADIGYIYETEKIGCRVMYPKTTVYCNYYASFDEVGKILFDALGEDKDKYSKDIGYYRLQGYGNYFVKQHEASLSISYYEHKITHHLKIRENFNAVEIPETLPSNEEAKYGN